MDVAGAWSLLVSSLRPSLALETSGLVASHRSTAVPVENSSLISQPSV